MRLQSLQASLMSRSWDIYVYLTMFYKDTGIQPKKQDLDKINLILILFQHNHEKDPYGARLHRGLFLFTPTQC